jgi:hypothetical protein
VERPSPYRLNLSEKAFHGTVIPGQTFSSDTNYTFLRGRAKTPLLQKRSDCAKCFRACANEEKPAGQGSNIQGLSADLLEAARRCNLSVNSLAAYERIGHDLRLRSAWRALGVEEITAHGLWHSATTLPARI